MGDSQLDVNQIIAALKEQIGNQAVDIAMLKATIAAMSQDNDEVE